MPIDSELVELLGRLHPALLSNEDWLPHLIEAHRPGTSTPLRRHISRLIEHASNAIIEGCPQSAANYIALALHCDAQKTRVELGSSGVLRCSKYEFKTSILAKVVDKLLTLGQPLSLPDNVTRYLESVSNLLKVGRAVGRLNNSLQSFLIRNKYVGLKTIIAFTDALFMTGHNGKPSFSSSGISGYSKEELAEAASYIIYLYDKTVGMHDLQFNFIAETAVVRGLYAKVLIKACKVRHYCEAEILLDAFDYGCKLLGRKASVFAPTPDFEKSIRLGYIQMEQAKQPALVKRIKAIRDGDVSIMTIVEGLYERHHDKIVALRDHPIPRYVYQFPDFPEFREMFRHEGLTIEERMYLQDIILSELVTFDEIKDFEIILGVLLYDILKVQRLLTFFSRVSANHLKKVLEEDPKLAYRSLVPVFKKQMLRELFRWCVPDEKIEPILHLMTLRSGTPGVMDIQYKPIIDGGGYYLVPLNIAGASNWYRNFAFAEKRRVIESAEEEGASKALVMALGNASKMIRREYETVFKKQRIEIDTVCRFGDYLFVFECKHALLPCNAFELRTSYKHMQTAAKQLTRISSLLADEQTQLELYKRLEWEVGPAKEIVTCIVSCNGMFPGLTVDGHPVRRLAELVNMIETGDVRMVSVSVSEDEEGLDVQTNDLIECNLWEASEITPTFLRKYIADDLLRPLLFDAMVGVERSYIIDEWEFAFQTYALSVQETINAMKAMKA